jgi:hypothetical protein
LLAYRVERDYAIEEQALKMLKFTESLADLRSRKVRRKQAEKVRCAGARAERGTRGEPKGMGCSGKAYCVCEGAQLKIAIMDIILHYC